MPPRSGTRRSLVERGRAWRGVAYREEVDCAGPGGGHERRRHEEQVARARARVPEVAVAPLVLREKVDEGRLGTARVHVQRRDAPDRVAVVEKDRVTPLHDLQDVADAPQHQVLERGGTEHHVGVALGGRAFPRQLLDLK